MTATDPPQGVDLDRLTPWFRAHVPDADPTRPLRIELITGGKSNLTYEVTDDVRRWVLRRPPLGHVLATAHDMVREFRVISGLANSAVPVPAAIALCEDTAVNDAPFYVMEFVDGRIPKTSAAIAAFTPAEAGGTSEAVVDVLADLHSVDPVDARLADFGRPDGFLGRNLARWGTQWAASKTRPLPELDEIGRRLVSALPASGPAAIVHGDYRLDNTMLAPDDPTRIVAVLDWEMSTLGDPLTDLGLLLTYWGNRDTRFVTPILDPDRGWMTTDAIARRYAARTGRDLSALDFYVVFAHYKLAIILEGINARFQMGKTVGDGFDHMAPLVSSLAERALEVADDSALTALHA